MSVARGHSRRLQVSLAGAGPNQIAPRPSEDSSARRNALKPAHWRRASELHIELWVLVDLAHARYAGDDR